LTVRGISEIIPEFRKNLMLKAFMKMTHALRTAFLVVTGFGAALRGHSQPSTISFDTSPANAWTVSAGGATRVTPYFINGLLAVAPGQYQQRNLISVTSTADGTGAFVPGGSLTSFGGYWVADFTFFLPANASAVSLNYANFGADDRAVLSLNGAIFDATGVFGFGQPGAVPSMVFTDGGALEPYSFQTPSGSVSGAVTTGFNIGGLNTIEAIVNNTDQGVFGPNVGIAAGSSGDGAALALTGTVSFTVVPEPSSVVLGALGAGILALLHIRRRQR
jgi:hypothetical protein